MRVVIQRVKNASVRVSDKVISKIGLGFLILLGIEADDSDEDIKWLVRKLANLRVFSDENGDMNLDISQVNGDVIVVSQFTLHASTKKGKRPSFIRAARPEIAVPLYETFVRLLEDEVGKKVQTGDFGAMMDIALVNAGPVTIVMDSKVKE